MLQLATAQTSENFSQEARLLELLVHRGFIAGGLCDGGQNVRDEERQVDQEQQPKKHIAGDRLLNTLGIDPNKWTVGDRRLALLGRPRKIKG